MNYETVRGTRAFSFLAALAVVLAAGAAAGATPTAKPATPAKSPPAATKPPPAPDKKTEAKFGAYIRLMNAESDSVFGERSRLLRTVKDQKAGPTCDEAANLVLYPPNDESKARYADYRKRLLEKPKLPGDESALTMVSALEELLEPRLTASTRSGMKPEEKAKQCATFQQLYPKLLAGFTKYVEAYRALDPLVEKFADERDQRELLEVQKKYGKRHRYEFQQLVLAAKALIRSVDKESRREAPESGAIKAALGAYQQVVDEAKALYKADDPSKDLTPPSYSLMLIDSTPDFARTVQRYVDTIDGHASNRKASLEAQPRDCITSFNQLVERMNRVQFSAKQK